MKLEALPPQAPAAVDTAATVRHWLRRPLVVMTMFLVAAELAARLIAPQLPPNTPWGFEPIDIKVEQMEALGQAQVVFLGDSVSQAGLDPTGFVAASALFDTAYNASIDGAGGRFHELWAQEVVVPVLQPEVVVIGLTSRSLNDNSEAARTMFGRYTDSYGRAEARGEASIADQVEHRLSGLFDLVSIRAFLRNPKELAESWGEGDSGAKVLDRFGAEHFPPGRYITEGLDTKVRQRALNNYAVGEVDLPALDRLITDLRAAGIAVVLVDMPVVEDDYAPLHPGGQADLDLYRTELRALAEARAVPLVDGATLVDGDADFVDFYHLNENGAALLSAGIVDVVEAAAG